MASIINGFECDIFISYRQNDNKYDGWVTDFVINLRKELQATFKEEVNVYFDENPHDGLLEMHQVSDSLKHKIKALIFIPILSQTYCDPKSFAWRNEFVAFKKNASEDHLGLLVKLVSSGNVVSRIIPVRIHELDQDDKKLIENELGPLRSINFIYKAPGVNRPLRANEDRPHDNQDKTYYRDQINKVANLTKEIISSLVKSSGATNVSSPNQDRPEPLPSNRKKSGVFITSILIFSILIIAGYYLFSRVNKPMPSVGTKVSLAVLPFKIIGKEEESQYFADGVMEVILSNLTVFPELTVKPASSVERFRNTDRPMSDIAQELNVQYILEGSAQKLADDIRIVVRLIDAQSDNTVWSETYIKKFSEVFETQNQISAAIAQSLKAKLTPDIKLMIYRQPTSDFEAYDLFLRAKQMSKKFETSHNRGDLQQSIRYVSEAIKRDDQFALGFAWLAGLKAIERSDTMASEDTRDSILLLANHALQLDSSLVEANLVLSRVYDYLNDNVLALRYSYQALAGKLSDTTYTASMMTQLAAIYARLGETDKAIYLYDQLLSISPDQQEFLQLKFIPLASSGRLDELIKVEVKVSELWPNSSFLNLIRTHRLAEQKDYRGLITLYDTWKMNDADLNLLDQYVFIYANALKKVGRAQEAITLIKRFESQIGSDNKYLQAQVHLFSSRKNEALLLLDSVRIGWYNLSVSTINPLFDPVRSESQFKRFISQNTERMADERARIRQHESNGFLPTPQDYFEGLVE